jgi:hypothetical protein
VAFDLVHFLVLVVVGAMRVWKWVFDLVHFLVLMVVGPMRVWECLKPHFLMLNSSFHFLFPILALLEAMHLRRRLLPGQLLEAIQFRRRLLPGQLLEAIHLRRRFLPGQLLEAIRLRRRGQLLEAIHLRRHAREQHTRQGTLGPPEFWRR